MAYGIEVVVHPQMILGESLVWNETEQKLYCVDIFGQTLHRVDVTSGADDTLPLSKRVNSFAFRKSGGLIAGCWDGFGEIDCNSGEVTLLDGIATPRANYFLNDGRCDPAGRFLAGQVCETYDNTDAALFKLDSDLSQHKLTDGIVASNGMAFSPDGRTMYFADSVLGVIWAFDYDVDDGVVSNRRSFAHAMRPDGAAVDSDGCYWITCFGHSEVIRFTPDGKEDRVIRLPASQLAMCAFGGRNMDTLFVASSTFRISQGQEKRQELAGALFAITGLGATGMVEPHFAG